ncbi:MAG: glycosyltransferase family 1 protein [Tannerella sp.]|jgi:hypothetical protein|nr:glycosyltransferase family 1 protein [Tannerella sp.]
MDKTLHIVALNIPWPANYGGVIDIYYKLKALHDCGVQIILHCFEYERRQAAELHAVCEKVYYYPRHTGMLANLTRLPYNVYGRKNSNLLENLLKNDAPILFEGLHTCYWIGDRRLEKRTKIFRECNIEHDYYRETGKAETNPLKKCFYFIEAARFKSFQKQAKHADLILSVSTADAAYLKGEFPGSRIAFIPCFHENEQVSSLPGQSDFLLYHAKLSVRENEKAALYMIRHIFSQMSCTCVIAGMNPPKTLCKAAAPCANIQIEPNPSAERMHQLIREAQVNLLVTFQATGLKLKLLNSLFAGRHIVVNPLMLSGSGLDRLCHTAETSRQLIDKCQQLMNIPFTEQDIQLRKEQLYPTYSNKYQAQKLTGLIWNREDRKASDSAE